MSSTHRGRLTSCLLACLLAVPVLATLAPTNGAAAADAPSWDVSWSLNRSSDIDELSRNFDHDEDGVVDVAADPAGRLPDILNPEQSTLHVQACAAPAGFTSIEWTLARPGEAPLPAVSSTECETDLVLPDKPYPVAREYTLTATVHYAGAADVVRESHVRVQDIFMVAFGDSYGSGEGNPLTVDEWFGSQESTWDNKRCHRSRFSGQEIAAHDLDALPGVTVTLLHLACSGALAAAGVLEPYMGIEPHSDHLPPLAPQIDQAQEYVNYSVNAAGAPRYPDVIVTSIGGNDAGFADIVTACIEFPSWVPVPIPVFPFVVPVDLDQCYEDGEAGDVRFKEGLAVLPGLYDQIEDAVHGTAEGPGLCDPNLRCDFLITEYPDGATDENGDFCSALPGFSEDEFEWVMNEMVPTLDGLIETSATENGWTFVGGVRENFDGHGVCAEDDYFRDVLESHDVQSGIDGAFHPNTSGHLWGYAPAIVDSLREVLDLPYSNIGSTFVPMYVGDGSPTTCDTVTGDGNRERAVAAPPSSPAALNLPSDIETALVNGQLPRATVYSNSCSSLAQPRLPIGQTPQEMRAGTTGCSNDARVCTESAGSGSFLHLPVWGDQAPVLDARSGVDAYVTSDDELPTQRHRNGSAGADGTTALYAAPAAGSNTVTGEVVVDMDAIAQSGGAKAHGQATISVEVTNVTDEEVCYGDECFPSTSTAVGKVDLTIGRATCQADGESGYDCGSGTFANGARYDTRQLRVWHGDQLVTNISDNDEGPYSTNVGVGAGVAVGSGVREPMSTVRLPYSVPAGSVVVVTVRANSYTDVGEECAFDWVHFPCSAMGRSSAQVGFAPNGATGLLVPLSGFVAPVPTDTVPPTVAAQVTGTAGSNGWYKSPVSVAVIGTDDQGGSGVQSVTTVLDGGQPVTVTGPTTTVDVAGDGTHTVTYSATDASGNVSQPVSTTVRIDRGLPGITITPLENAQYASNAVVATGLVCADAISGVATCTGPATLDTSTPGSHTATFNAVDKAGNAASRTLSYWVLAPAPTRDTVDIRIPELGYSITGSVATGGFDVRFGSNGQLTSVSGTATYVRSNGNRVTVTVAAVRVLGVWIGAVSISDPTARVNVTAATISRSGVTAVGTNGARGTFTTGGSQNRTVNWTITDLG